MLYAGAVRQGQVVPALGSWAADQARRDRLRPHEAGMFETNDFRKPVGPPQQRRLAAASDQRGVMLGEQLGDRPFVTRRGRLLNGVADPTAFTKPHGSSCLKGTRSRRIRVSELELQELCEEVVVAIP